MQACIQNKVLDTITDTVNSEKLKHLSKCYK